MKISKEFKLEAAHKLKKGYSYTEKCQHIHGHSYRIIVELESKILNKDGMVMDFGELKSHCLFVEEWDHSFMIWEKDELFEGSNFASFLQGYRVNVTNFNPTAENMAIYIAQELGRKLPHFNVGVKVRETETSEAYAINDSVDKSKITHKVWSL